MTVTMNHTGFVVSDLDKAIEFYGKGLGLKIVLNVEAGGPELSQWLGYDNARVKAAFMSGDDGHSVELIEYLNPPVEARDPAEQHRRNVTGAAHLAFIVDDIEETHRRLVSLGAKKLNPPVQAGEGLKGCYLQDPDGNWIELDQDDVHARTPYRVVQNTVPAAAASSGAG